MGGGGGGVGPLGSDYGFRVRGEGLGFRANCRTKRRASGVIWSLL